MDDREKILDKVRKLLELSKSSDPNEAANAARHAQALLTKHRLSQEDVLEEERGIFEVDDTTGTSAPFWEILLINIIAHVNECKMLRSSFSFHLVGAKKDAELVDYLFKFFRSEVNRVKTEFEEQAKDWENQQTATVTIIDQMFGGGSVTHTINFGSYFKKHGTDSKSFIMGVTQAICDSFVESAQEAHQEETERLQLAGECTSLMPLNALQRMNKAREENDEFLRDHTNAEVKTSDLQRPDGIDPESFRQGLVKGRELTEQKPSATLEAAEDK